MLFGSWKVCFIYFILHFSDITFVQFGFAIIFSRDSWVHALRQAIKPHVDEIRRIDNSLKIWILEAKGVGGGSGKHSSSKRYFCELYLDEVLYARTCGKPRADMLFWGEHFEFTQLPNCVQHITIIFFREGDKKRKKDRNTCIGKAEYYIRGFRFCTGAFGKCLLGS